MESPEELEKEFIQKIEKTEAKEKMDEVKEKALSLIKSSGGVAAFQERVEAELKRAGGETELDRAKAIESVLAELEAETSTAVFSREELEAARKMLEEMGKAEVKKNEEITKIRTEVDKLYEK